MNAAEMNIDTFKTKFKTGARPYLFYFEPHFPTTLGGNVGTQMDPNPRFLVRSSALPTSAIEEIRTPWQGFDYIQGGKRTYGDLTVSFHVDLKATIRKFFLAWHDKILDPKTNIHAFPDEYMKDQTITLLGLDFQPILSYHLWYAFPSDVGQVALDYGSAGDMANFDVTFKYTYFTWSQDPDSV
jgi:hypothetical protein